MNVLVTAASKHGATAEIAEAVGRVLTEHGHVSSVVAPEEVRHVDDFDAVVIGSAVYAGHWLKPAKELIERTQERLVAIPVWTFSSGPIGDPAKPDEDPVDVADVLSAVNSTEHMLFAGKLDKETLGFAERAITKALKAPDGDFRDWDAISAWATAIASELAEPGGP
ncbi:MAG: flavodoxin [Acidimicrobiia bacterium]|nr:flavodoxin domain-containing protein [Acidimicrobiia bacterium]NNL14174.1 flavodoxin [Acidimicrobiia bacterium]